MIEFWGGLHFESKKCAKKEQRWIASKPQNSTLQRDGMRP